MSKIACFFFSIRTVLFVNLRVLLYSYLLVMLKMFYPRPFFMLLMVDTCSVVLCLSENG